MMQLCWCQIAATIVTSHDIARTINAHHHIGCVTGTACLAGWRHAGSGDAGAMVAEEDSSAGRPNAVRRSVNDDSMASP